MAKFGEVPTDLTLDIGGDISPDEFLSAVRNFFGYVREITEAQQGDGTAVDWTVKVKEGSSLVGLEPSVNAPVSRLAMIYKKASFGVQALTRGDIHGSGLTEKAVNHLKVLSEIGEKSKRAPRLQIWVLKHPISVNAGISKAIKEALESDYFDFGTIEGRLEAIKDTNGSLKVGIRDYLYPKMINCDVPESMIDRVFSSFRRRVELTGRIHFRHDGQPISIETSEIDVLPEDDELPSSRDVRGILASA
jgi:hypothetical protein